LDCGHSGSILVFYDSNNWHEFYNLLKNNPKCAKIENIVQFASLAFPKSTVNGLPQGAPIINDALINFFARDGILCYKYFALFSIMLTSIFGLSVDEEWNITGNIELSDDCNKNITMVQILFNMRESATVLKQKVCEFERVSKKLSDFLTSDAVLNNPKTPIRAIIMATKGFTTPNSCKLIRTIIQRWAEQWRNSLKCETSSMFAATSNARSTQGNKIIETLRMTPYGAEINWDNLSSCYPELQQAIEATNDPALGDVSSPWKMLQDMREDLKSFKLNPDNFTIAPCSSGVQPPLANISEPALSCKQCAQ